MGVRWPWREGEGAGESFTCEQFEFIARTEISSCGEGKRINIKYQILNTANNEVRLEVDKLHWDVSSDSFLLFRLFLCFWFCYCFFFSRVVGGVAAFEASC